MDFPTPGGGDCATSPDEVRCITQGVDSHPFTRALPQATRATLAGLAEEVSFRAEDTVLRAGERSRYFHLLIAGSMFLELQTAVYSVSIQVLHPGDSFGWSALTDHSYVAFQVRAREDCRVIRFPGDRMLALCDQDPAVGSMVFRQVAELVSRRLHATEARLLDFCGVASPLRPRDTRRQHSES